MATLSIQIDEPTAAAYDSASPEERERIERRLTTLLRASLTSKQDRIDAFVDAADVAGREAQANGWTDDLDAALLKGEFDDES